MRSATGAVIIGLLVAVVFLPVMFLLLLGGGEDPCAGASGSVRVDGSSVAGIEVPGYDAEQLGNAAAIIKAGADLNLSSRDQAIGVMTAIGESGLRVLDHGDAAGSDSRGLFQQRDNGSWGSYEQRMDPYQSATSFFSALMHVPNRDSMEPTLVAHAVQQNADPYHYQPKWADAEAIVAAFDGRTITTSSSGTSATSGVVDTARTHLGVPYRWGGSDPSGFDCSGLVQYVFGQLGVALPRTAAEQGATGQEVYSGSGQTVPWDQLQPGDVIFFPDTGGATYDHVGIYSGNQQMVHAPQSGEVVKEVPLADAYWQGRDWSVRRMGEVSGATSAQDSGEGSGQCSTSNASLNHTQANADGWARPAAGPVTSNYGMRVHPVLGTSRLHAGTDLAGGGCDGPIYAAADGTVTFAGSYQDGTGAVEVDHGGGVSTLYLHMKESGIHVRQGQSVKAGQHIAAVNTTGNSTGCHLHFEVHINGGTVDPEPFMRDRGVDLGAGG